MLSDPNIQSIDRSRFNNEFTLYLGRVLNQVYPNGSHILPVLILFGLLLMLALIIISCRRKEKSMFFLSLYVFVLTVMFLCSFVIQCVFPYLRVFTYMGSVLSMMFVLMPYALWAIVKPAADRLAQRRSFSLPARSLLTARCSQPQRLYFWPLYTAGCLNIMQAMTAGIIIFMPRLNSLMKRKWIRS